MISFWIVVLVYVLLGLLETEAIARKARAALSAGAAHVLIDGSALTASKLRRFLLVRTIMSLATGSMVWALSAAFGLRFAAEWGVIAFTLNYIPFIGPFVATLLPTLYALAQFGSPQSAVFIFAGLNVIQFIIGSYIEPRVAGYALAISPFLVLFSVFFWMFLWGLFGAFIGVPITIAILTYCSQSPSTDLDCPTAGLARRKSPRLAPRAMRRMLTDGRFTNEPGITDPGMWATRLAKPTRLIEIAPPSSPAIPTPTNTASVRPPAPRNVASAAFSTWPTKRPSTGTFAASSVNDKPPSMPMNAVDFHPRSMPCQSRAAAMAPAAPQIASTRSMVVVSRPDIAGSHGRRRAATVRLSMQGSVRLPPTPAEVHRAALVPWFRPVTS